MRFPQDIFLAGGVAQIAEPQYHQKKKKRLFFLMVVISFSNIAFLGHRFEPPLFLSKLQVCQIFLLFILTINLA
jgi:hypothetical protein